MNIKTCVGCLSVLFLCGIPNAQAAPSWAHAGQWYKIAAPKETPLLPDGAVYDLAGYTTEAVATVKIIEVGSGEWARVEYNSGYSTPGIKPVVVERRRTWVNFAYVVNAVLTTEPDLKTNFPDGVTLVPYKGTNK